MQNTAKNPNAIKEAIPYGGIKIIAQRSNTSIFTVGRVIKGKSYNPKALKALNEYLVEINAIKTSNNEIAASIISN